IGERFLSAGVGFGGSCFPKDIKALLHSADKVGYQFRLLKAALEVNESQKVVAISKLKKHLGCLAGKTIGLLGLSFKPDTDDIREAPSVVLIRALLEERAVVKAHDPKAEKRMRELFTEIQYCDLAYDVAVESDGLVLVTEWQEFSALDADRLKKLMKTPLIIDGRNMFEPEKMRKAGFIYEGIGRADG
ncbi:UDP binding domain-containing protein, partial [Candidatus Margulisiibacteriota bacterium]